MAKKPRIEGILDFDLDQIERPEIPPHQEKGVGVLAESIRSHGLLQPIGIRLNTDTGLYEIIWGKRRFAAHLLLDKEGYWKPKQRKIRAVVVKADDLVAAEIGHIENVARSFGFIDECISLAKVHRESESSIIELARMLDMPRTTLGSMINIGYMPEKTLKKLQANKTWHHAYTIELLPLRLDSEGNILSAGGPGLLKTPEDIEYSEVNKAIDLVEKGKITSRNALATYVAQRRFEIQQKQVEKQVQTELKKREAEIREGFDIRFQRQLDQELAAIEAKHNTELENLSKRLKQAVEEARRARVGLAELRAGKEKAEDFEKRLAEKEEDITERDTRVAQLVGEIEKVKASILQQAEEIAAERIEPRLTEIRAELDAEYGERLDAFKEHYVQLEEELKSKAEARIERLVNTIFQLQADLLNRIGVLVYDQNKLLGPSHIDDLLLVVDRLLNSGSEFQATLIHLREGGRIAGALIVIEGEE